MDYEKAYKEALGRAKGIHTFSSDIVEIKRMEQIFPELAESEDEKIRKEIIDFLWKEKIFLQECHLSVENSPKYHFVMDAIAWLEKQGGQKPFDYENANIQQNNFAPKFKLGDWIVWKDKCYKVNDNGCGYELIDTNGLSTSLEYGTVDENAHLWTIEDAKNGDVLATKDDVFIFKHMDKTRLFLCKSYCEVIGNSKLGLGFYFSINGVHPATKEQSDLLFQKMYEAGYEFDFNKKELKKTECLCISPEEYNKAVNECWGRNKSKWTDEDDYNVQCCIAKAECDIENGCIGRNKELIEWLKSLKQRLI